MAFTSTFLPLKKLANTAQNFKSITLPGASLKKLKVNTLHLEINFVSGTLVSNKKSSKKQQQQIKKASHFQTYLSLWSLIL